MLPLPRPQFEIFVYSPRVEGVHLRGGKVARGGLRWSDRREDFRTEVLGLMKAQMVKNALIVPVGSKGGFVVKRPPADGGRDELLEEGIACYRTFLSGLLDVTDNIVGGEVVAPDRVVRYDDDDPYLVVAADKGTATFSDIANEVSASYGFWLGDAFASGGSQGYDHKAMGITARGAWESVKRHFRELGATSSRPTSPWSAIGDMSGDVFGNGMLLSRHIKLVAAFNHMHVFLDPDPDPEASFAERKRLFELPRSSWSDYDEALISEGGGVYPRTAKSIPISPQAGEALGIEDEELSPNELIRAILRAPVDLLWNGGIGTYVKASDEATPTPATRPTTASASTAASCAAASSARAATSASPSAGGSSTRSPAARINTDAIDNVAGVNCSDHEVNIKILLGSLVADGELTRDQRNELLVEMTDAVAEQVLYGSYTQTQAMSIALAQAASMVDVHARLIQHLEQVAGLDRELEFLPDDETIAERKGAHDGAGRARARGRDGVLQDPPVRRAARVRPARRPVPVPRSRALLPAAAARALQRPDAVAPAAPRDHRDGRRQPARRPRRHHVRVPAARGDRRPAVDAGPRVRGRARGVRDARILDRRRGARQPGRRRRSSSRC